MTAWSSTVCGLDHRRFAHLPSVNHHNKGMNTAVDNGRLLVPCVQNVLHSRDAVVDRIGGTWALQMCLTASVRLDGPVFRQSSQTAFSSSTVTAWLPAARWAVQLRRCARCCGVADVVCACGSCDSWPVCWLMFCAVSRAPVQRHSMSAT